jgi:hypothetical protein
MMIMLIRLLTVDLVSDITRNIAESGKLSQIRFAEFILIVMHGHTRISQQHHIV